jgi:F0F1-type ATP synthase membrane subunit b/b'
MFDEAKEAVAVRLADQRAALQRESVAARESLRAEARALADAMVAAVLGRKA